MEQEVAMRDIESAARELEADYTVVLGRVKTLEARNEELEKDLVDKSSRLENEVREVEVLLLQLKESKERQERLNRECEYMQSEISQLSKKCSDFDRLQEVCRDQEIQIEALTTKLNEFAKLSASIQLYKNRISLQNEQIVSLQGKLRESISYPPEEVLYSSPINTRSQDLTYASSSLRGLQQAVDRSTSLRATRNRDMGATADISLISGESSRRRRDYYVPRR
jgi:chromosome segregation ATPase